MQISRQIFIIVACFTILILFGCSKKDNNNSTSNDIWDLDKAAPPKFVNTNYIELSNIYRISKYRSSIGHDYSDASEHCRSMKHYFESKSTADWSVIKIFSPVTGEITRYEQEWAGVKVEIASDQYPAFRFSIFHINISNPLKVGDHVIAGQQLGTHIGSETYSDISVIVNDPTHQGIMVSFFDVMTDNLFKQFSDRGVSTKDMLIITKDLRDANPLTCNGDTFLPGDPLECWVVLN